MSNVNFAQLLDKRADTIEKPKPLPMGTFSFVVGDHELLESAQKKTPFVRFWSSPRVASEDVDQEILAEVKNWQDRKMKLDFYITEDAEWRLVRFLEHCGLSVEGRTLAELIPETKGAMFNGYVKHETAQNGEDIFANIDGTAPAE